MTPSNASEWKNFYIRHIILLQQALNNQPHHQGTLQSQVMPEIVNFDAYAQIRKNGEIRP
jgi:hypothetical protein